MLLASLGQCSYNDAVSVMLCVGGQSGGLQCEKFTCAVLKKNAR
jgi:hypothetical protein